MKSALLACSLPLLGQSISLHDVPTGAPQKTTFEPSDGDVYVGDLACSHANVGLKLVVEKYPDDLKVEVFPQAYYDMAGSHQFCRPLTTCNASYQITKASLSDEEIAVTPAGLALFDPLSGSTGLSDSCGWPEIGLAGNFAPRHFSGTIRGDATFRVRTDIGEIQRPIFCKSKEVDVRTKGRSVTCSHFDLRKCERPPPARGEKAVYAVMTTQGNGVGGDGFLGDFGKKAALNLNQNSIFEMAMSDNPAGRAQVILTSPTARAMQTAILAFGGLGLNIVLDPNLMTQGDHLNWNKENGEQVLIEANQTSLLAQYRQLWESMNEEGAHKGVVSLGNNRNRNQRLRQLLLLRPEQRIIVVGHRHLFEDIQIIPRGMGSAAVELRVLGRNGQWRDTSEPRCWV